MLRQTLAGLMARFFPPCAEVTRLASESMDRNLTFPERLNLKIHFMMCVLCDRYQKHLLFMREAIRSHPDRLENQDTPPTPELSPDARARIQRALSSI